MAGADRRRVAGEGPGTKVPADISNQDPQLILRKRLRAEMEALRGLLRKAKLLSGKTVGNGRAAARCGKDGRFLAAEHRSEGYGGGEDAMCQEKEDDASRGDRRRTQDVSGRDLQPGRPSRVALVEHASSHPRVP